ncbi:MAG: hypothetical protein IPQ25_04640 [Chitinophagaceae bacterium]|mgnify:FL=1|nr:hypothetical protein [Chitinophagaceae bacterium]HQV59249.1 hypothetical protein [Chitinophagaceae bacterium]HQV84721.1 hypothetical protein [Chitinophagaceae bacterium]HQX71730.1 hypothetical protein [Chitinophagaceae bacterium]HQZ76151.1 hypothetical protein [Chitinophagaceae bacterium]
MENSTSDKSLFDLSFDENVKQSLKGAATWGGLAAIVSLIGSILGLVNYFVEKGKESRYGGNSLEEMQIQQAANTGGFVSVVITLIIGIILFYFLNKFSRSAKAGIDTNDHYLINEGLGSLSTYFKFIGVLLIIILVLFALGILIGIGQGV